MVKSADENFILTPQFGYRLSMRGIVEIVKTGKTKKDEKTKRPKQREHHNCQILNLGVRGLTQGQCVGPKEKRSTPYPLA